MPKRKDNNIVFDDQQLTIKYFSYTLDIFISLVYMQLQQQAWT